jgi:tetratricopeptide (TPR) repeat protein
LKGRYLSNLLTFETFQKANEAFEKAIYHDSNYALAYEGLSYNYIQSIDLYLPTSEALSKAKEYAEKALSLDVDLPQAHADLGAVHFWYDWDWEKAESEFLRALEINPKLASSLRLYAWFLIFMQRFDESFDLFEQVRKLDPFSFENMLYTIPSHYFARDYDQAVKDISRGIQSFPDFWLGHIMLGRCFEAKGEVEKAFAKYEKALSLDSVPEIYGDVGRSYALLGKKEKALETLRELEKIAEIKYVAPFNFAMIYLGLGDLDKTFEYLEACYEERSWYLTWLKIAPVFDPLREDERFISLMKRVGI